MSEYQNLAQLSEPIEVRLYRLVTKSHLRIGAGEGSADISAAENPIIRALIYQDGDDARVPYIPGSSLHGVTRAWVEKALRSSQEPLSRERMQEILAGNKRLEEEIKKEMAEFLGRNEPGDVTLDDLAQYWPIYPNVCNPLLLTDQCERISRRDLETRDWKIKYLEAIPREVPCQVCNIFGYVGQRGRVKVTPAFPAATHRGNVPVDVITRVAINRLTGAADEGKLFDLEAIPPGVTFYFFTVMENMGETEKGHFNKGIRAMNLQFAGLGAHSTIGFGMVDVHLEYAVAIKPQIFDYPVESWLDESLKGSSQLSADLDQDKYPRFFRALTLVGQPAKEKFAGLVTYT